MTGIPNERRCCGLLVTLFLAILTLAHGQTTGSSQAATIPDTPAGKLFSAWLEAYNSGDHDKMLKFQTEHLPAVPDARREQRLKRMQEFREQTGGFTVEKVESASPNRLRAPV